MVYFFKFLIIFSLFISSLDAHELQHISLQLNWKYQFEFAGFIAAKEKGFYKEEGLDVALKEYEIGMNIVDEVINNKATFGVASSTIIMDYLNDKSIVLIASIFKKSALVIVTQPEIKTLKELYGKTFMSTIPDITELNFMFELQNIDVKKIKVIPHTFDIKDFVDKKVDAMSAYKSDQLYKLDKLGVKYNVIDPSDYGLYSLQNEIFTTSNRYNKDSFLVKKFKRATIKGWEYALKHKEELVDIISQKYSHNISKDALLAEANVIDNIIFASRYNLGEIDKLFLKRQFNYMKKKYNPKSEKTLNHLLGIENRYSKLFTKQEQKYLQKKKVIKVCYDKTFYPFLYSKNGKYYGFSKDFIELISERTELKFSYVQTDDWVEQLEYLREGWCDTTAIIITKPNYYDYLTPSLAYSFDQVVLSTKIDEPYFSSLKELKDKTIGIKYGFSTLKKFLEAKYPNIKFIYIKSKPYKAILEDRIFGYVTISLDASSSIAKYYSNQLKIMTKVMKNEIGGGFGVSNKEPVLQLILNKAIQAVPQMKRRNLLQSYYNIKVEEMFDWETFFYLASLFILILFVGVLFFLREKRFNIKLEKRVENATHDLRLAEKIAKIGFWKFDNRTKELFWSDEVYTMFEVDKMVSEVKTNEDCLHYIFKDDISKIQRAFHQHIKDKKDFIVTHRIVTGDNHSKYIEQRCETTFDDEGNALVSVGTAQDISERKFLEKQLLEQVRLAQMGEMISMIAHQWRQPLNAISSTSTALNLKAEFNDLDKEFVIKSTNNISRYSQHLSNTIDDFRDFFKPNKEIRETSYLKLIGSVLGIIGTSIKNKNIDLVQELQSERVFNSYPNEIKQVILNIIKNAEDILLEKEIKEPKIVLKTYDNILEISDNGGGMTDEVMVKVFDPYFSTKTEKNGTGLGLYMSKTIIEEHCKGKLTVSNSSEGAVFKIELP